MKVVVYREVMMEDLDRLDIELLDEKGKDLYFIEIKWVGDSIHADGNQFGTTYNANRINPSAVIQVVGYINQLLEEKQNIKIGYYIKERSFDNKKVGYLLVFDARKEDLVDTGDGVTESVVPEKLRKHYHRYKKLKDFRVININPR